MYKYKFFSLVLIIFFLPFLFSACEKEGIGSIAVKTCVVPSDSDNDILSGFFFESKEYEVFASLTNSKGEEIKKLQSIGTFTFPPVWNSNFTTNIKRYLEITCFNDIPPGKNYKLNIVLSKTLNSGSDFSVSGYLKSEILVDKVVNGQKKVLTVDCDEY